MWLWCRALLKLWRKTVEQKTKEATRKIGWDTINGSHLHAIPICSWLKNVRSELFTSNLVRKLFEDTLSYETINKRSLLDFDVGLNLFESFKTIVSINQRVHHTLWMSTWSWLFWFSFMSLECIYEQDRQRIYVFPLFRIMSGCWASPLLRWKRK